MHPTVKLRLVLIPSIAKQIPTPLCEHKAWENKRIIRLLKAPASFHLAPYLNTENTRAILPIARILFLMTSLRKLAALPARRWTRRWKEKGEKEKLISSSVAIKSLSKLTSKKKENVWNFLQLNSAPKNARKSPHNRFPERSSWVKIIIIIMVAAVYMLSTVYM